MGQCDILSNTSKNEKAKLGERGVLSDIVELIVRTSSGGDAMRCDAVRCDAEKPLAESSSPNNKAFSAIYE